MEAQSLTTLTRLTSTQRAYLQRGQLTSITDVLLLSIPDLARRCKIVHSEAAAILDTVCGELQSEPRSIDDSGIPRDQWFTTGDLALDDALGGGIRTRKLWEVVGESAAGKTQLCLQLSLSVQLPERLGGLSGSACLLSTSWTLPTARLLEIVDAHPVFAPSMCSLSDIHTVKTTTIPALVHVLSHLFPQLLQEVAARPEAKPVRLLVVDALTELFHSDPKVSAGSLVERAKNLAEISTLLHSLADKHNLAVVVVNEVVDAVERETPMGILPHEVLYRDQARLFNRADSLPGENRREAALGLAWANQVNARIMLSRTKRTRHLEPDQLPTKRRRLNSGDTEHGDVGETIRVRRLTITFNAVAPPASLDYVVTTGGIAVFADSSEITESEPVAKVSDLPSSSTPPSSPLRNDLAGGISDIAPLDIPTAEVKSSQTLPSDDDPHPPTDDPEEIYRASQELQAEDGPQSDEDEWEAYWRETDLGSDAFTQALDNYDPTTGAR